MGDGCLKSSARGVSLYVVLGACPPITLSHVMAQKCLFVLEIGGTQANPLPTKFCCLRKTLFVNKYINPFNFQNQLNRNRK